MKSCLTWSWQTTVGELKMKERTLSDFKDFIDSPTELRVALGEYIKKFGIPPTSQYLKILKYLLINEGHPSAEDVYIALSPSVPELSRSRVYTILELFSSHGIINKITLEGDVTHYDADVGSATHFVCEYCGAIKDVIADSRERQYPTDLHESAVVEEILVVYKGMCEKCAAEKKRKSKSKQAQS